MIKTAHTPDRYEDTARVGFGIVLLLIAWACGWTVIGTAALVLGLVALGTAIAGMSLVGLARSGARAKTPAPVPTPRPSHLGHDVHDWAHEAHPIDTEAL